MLPFVAGMTAAIALVSFYRLLTSNPLDQRIAQSKRRRVVFFGDSITQHGFNTEISGWVAMLAHWWSRRVDVINRGYSGYNSRWALQIVDKVVPSQRPDLVFVFFGANDAVDRSVLQHVPLDEFKRNMAAIVAALRAGAPDAALVLITPPPVWEEQLQFFNSNKGKPLLLDRSNERTQQYAQAVQALGQQAGLPVVDAWTVLEGPTARRAQYLSDGLHLSAQGCAALFAEIKEVLLQSAPQWNPALMDMDMPEWSQFEAQASRL